MAIPTMVMTAALVLAFAAPGGAAQAQKIDRRPNDTASMNFVDRTTKTINYQQRSGSTRIEFYGTILFPESRGEAKVENRRTYTEIEVVFRNLQSATRFGPEFLTYVMWAISPEGRATNLGELILSGTTSRLGVTTELQVFGLVVTAEPYFGATQPSDVVVMENFIKKDTAVKAGEIDAKYELLPRGHYTANVSPVEVTPLVPQKDTSLNLYEARNAVRIARWAGADVYASGYFQKASSLLAKAEEFNKSNFGPQCVEACAREAVLTAEDARLTALKIQSEVRLRKEREDSAIRAAAANAAAAKSLTDASDAFRASTSVRAQSERTRMDAELQLLDVVRDRQAIQAPDALATKDAAARSERDKQELRGKLALQLNAVLKTEDGASGLIMKMADGFFDTGQYLLKSGAEEKLSKISSIVLAYPTLKLEVVGYTDNAGTEQSNMVLSEKRANSVRNFLLTQGLDPFSISYIGFGEDRPAATNDTVAGRQQNRRVELVVSGEIIGSSSAIQAKVNP